MELPWRTFDGKEACRESDVGPECVGDVSKRAKGGWKKVINIPA